MWNNWDCVDVCRKWGWDFIGYWIGPIPESVSIDPESTRDCVPESAGERRAGDGCGHRNGDLAGDPRPMFPVEQFKSVDSGGGNTENLGEQVLGEIDRVERLIGGVAGGVGDQVRDEDDAVMGARMFAHEVNNLVMGISGWAQRALISGDSGHVSEALEMASEVGGRVAVLCELFMGGGVEIATRPSVLVASQVILAHRFALNCVAGHPVLVDGGGVDFEVDIEDGLVLVMPGMLLGQVLVNLYGNALDGIGRSGGSGGVVRLTVGRRGDVVKLVVEDSGCGFLKRGNGQRAVGNGEEKMKRREEEGKNEEVMEPSPRPSPQGRGRKSGNVGSLNVGRHGLGLGVCRALCGAFGGRVEVGVSEDLGGGLVRLVFD